MGTWQTWIHLKYKNHRVFFHVRLPFFKHGLYMTLLFILKIEDPGIGITKQYLLFFNLPQLADL